MKNFGVGDVVQIALSPGRVLAPYQEKLRYEVLSTNDTYSTIKSLDVTEGPEMIFENVDNFVLTLSAK